MPIDTLDASKRLKDLGFDEDQSEGLAQLLSKLDVASATAVDVGVQFDVRRWRCGVGP